MTRIKSYWFKEENAIQGMTEIRVVSENGKWCKAHFVFSEQNMRWERSDMPANIAIRLAIGAAA